MRICSPALLAAFLLIIVSACGGTPDMTEEVDAIPPGVSLDPPRSYPATGGVAEPGQPVREEAALGDTSGLLDNPAIAPPPAARDTME